MPKVALSAGFVSLNAVDISNFCQSVNLEVDVTPEEITGFGDLWQVFTTGMRSWTLQVEAINDYAATLLDSQLWALATGAAAVAIELRPSNAVVGVNNPRFTGSVLVLGYTPINVSVGKLPMASPKIQPTGPLVRATA